MDMAASSSSSAGAEEVAIGDKASQPSSFSFPKRKFGEKNPVYRSFQSSWFKKWPWLHYDQANDKAFCVKISEFFTEFYMFLFFPYTCFYFGISYVCV